MIEKYEVLLDVFNKVRICNAYWLSDLVSGIHPSFAGQQRRCGAVSGQEGSIATGSGLIGSGGLLRLHGFR
jgi:hypothetical protein